MKFSFIAAAISCLLASASAARGQSSLPPVPKEPIEGSFVFAGYASPEDWQFMMGPTGSPEMVARLQRSTPSGALGFVCTKKDGKSTMAFAAPQIPGAVGESGDIEVRVSEQSNLMRMSVRSPPLPERPPVWEGDGPGVAAIVDAMGTAPVWRRSGIAFRDTNGNTVEFPLVSPRGVALRMAAICRSWSDAASHTTPEPDNRIDGVPIDVGDGRTLLLPGSGVVTNGVNPATR